MKSDFDVQRTGTGTKEWAEVNFNIGLGCSNGCLYCYARSMAMRYKRIPDRGAWLREELTANANLAGYPLRPGVIMFPSTHDITPFYLPDYIRAALLMLEKGNRLLITTKPRMECLRTLLGAFLDYKDRVLFRFTIGSMDVGDVEFWEPGASLPLERLACLRRAFESGFQTSVSIEPMLAGRHEALRVLRKIYPFVTETVWIGLMNRVRSRLDMDDPLQVAAAEGIRMLQSPAEIRDLVKSVKLLRLDKVRWKDSIKQITNVEL